VLLRKKNRVSINKNDGAFIEKAPRVCVALGVHRVVERSGGELLQVWAAVLKREELGFKPAAGLAERLEVRGLAPQRAKTSQERGKADSSKVIEVLPSAPSSRI
jgi:hypothetical protein